MNKKTKLIAICTSLLVFIGVATTIAAITSSSNKINNFDEGIINANITETFNNVVKSNVAIQNTGNTEEYIRVFVNIYYKNSDGSISSYVPVNNTDYRITYSSSSNWLYNSADGYYYYKLPVSANASTDILINECLELTSLTDLIFNVDVLAQSIQATPTSAVTSAWGVNIVNNEISLGS